MAGRRIASDADWWRVRQLQLPCRNRAAKPAAHLSPAEFAAPWQDSWRLLRDRDGHRVGHQWKGEQGKNCVQPARTMRRLHREEKDSRVRFTPWQCTRSLLG